MAMIDAAMMGAVAAEAQAVDAPFGRALLAAFAEARQVHGQPSAIVCDTLPGKGIPSVVQREKVHYVRPRDPHELDGLVGELEQEAARWR